MFRLAREIYFEIYLKIYLPNTVKYMTRVTGATFRGARHRGKARTLLAPVRAVQSSCISARTASAGAARKLILAELKQNTKIKSAACLQLHTCKAAALASRAPRSGWTGRRLQSTIVRARIGETAMSRASDQGHRGPGHRDRHAARARPRAAPLRGHRHRLQLHPPRRLRRPEPRPVPPLQREVVLRARRRPRRNRAARPATRSSSP